VKKARGEISTASPARDADENTRFPGVGSPRWIPWCSKAPRFLRAPHRSRGRRIESLWWAGKSSGSKNLRTQEMNRCTTRRCSEDERVGLLRRRTQCWLDVFGRYGRRSRGVSRGHQAFHDVLESRCRIAHSRRGSPRSRQRTDVKAYDRVRSSRSRCARVPR
jgi:hypothetical protein